MVLFSELLIMLSFVSLLATATVLSVGTPAPDPFAATGKEPMLLASRRKDCLLTATVLWMQVKNAKAASRLLREVTNIAANETLSRDLVLSKHPHI
jgi:hypothetical protein